jgi:hypothetical protein
MALPAGRLYGRCGGIFRCFDLSPRWNHIPSNPDSVIRLLTIYTMPKPVSHIPQ